jgi:phosphoribosyl 1,2-cyclic phosphate phosphodiesterase
MKFLFLGTGASSGVPVISCKCSVCTSSDLKNQRLRTSGILIDGDKNFLIDVSPDIRLCALKYHITHIDAVLITHSHEDHIGGLNDLRPFSYLRNNEKIPMVLSESSEKILQIRFDYLSDRFDKEVLHENRGQIFINDKEIRYFTYLQQGMKVTGYRFGKFAYVTDIKEYEPAIFEDLEGVETLVLGAINENPSRMHFSIAEAIEFKEKIKSVKFCYLTHLSHEVDFETMKDKLSDGVFLAYDGLEIYV